MELRGAFAAVCGPVVARVKWCASSMESSCFSIACFSAGPSIMANGSAVSWQHINLLGEYDFSDKKLQDTIGIKPPKLEDQRNTFLGGAKMAELQGRNGLR
jgi:hypothetical protein